MSARLRRLLPWLALVVLAIGFLNFLWFFSESSTIGDAQRGYVSDGHYYLVHAGVATEVTKAAWDWSNIHAASLFITHPLALAAIAYLLLTQAFPVMTGTNDGAGAAQRVSRIRASGPVTASARTGAKIGELRATSPLVNVDVRPGGVVIKLIGMAPIGVEAAMITGIVTGRSFGAATIRVVHGEPGTPADIRLFLKESSPVAVALQGLLATGPRQGVVRAPQALDAPVVEPYPPIMKAMIIVGFGLSLVFAAVSLPFAGGLGGFGSIWSLGLVLIIGYNAWNWFIRNRQRW